MQEFLSYFQIPDVNILMRILLSIVLGFAIGLERELTNKWAGLRTHLLVCLGSCLFTILSIYGFSTAISLYPMGDPGRVAAQILTGIGFIGGGTVLRQGANVYGLTTAATLWMVASIGMACGCGKFNIALVSAILAVCILVLIRIFEKELIPQNLKNLKKLKISIVCSVDSVEDVIESLYSEFPEMFALSKKSLEHDEDKKQIVAKVCMRCKNPLQCTHEKLKEFSDIDSVTVQEIDE